MGIWLSHIQQSIVELFLTQVTSQNLQTDSRKEEEEAEVERRMSCLYWEKCFCNCRFWWSNKSMASEPLNFWRSFDYSFFAQWLHIWSEFRGHRSQTSHIYTQEEKYPY